MPSGVDPLINNDSKKRNIIVIKQIKTGCLRISRYNFFFLNKFINKTSVTKKDRKINLIANTGSDVEKEIIKGITAINT